MGRLRGAVLGIAVVSVVFAATTIPSAATTDRRPPSAVEAKKAKKKPKKALTACKLLTTAEITAALGTAPTEPPKTDSQSECDYSSPANYNFINISTSPLLTPSLWVQNTQSATATISVSGIGDQAFRSANNLTIMVRKGKRTLRIDQYLSGLSEAVIESLGKAATGRL
jgi:hypothetical protein